jgi:tetratricopeptide (TPR) repeat protein
MPSETAAPGAQAGALVAPESWLELARKLVELDHFDEAEAAFRQAIMRRPLYPAAHSELAQLIWMRSGDAEAACIVLNDAIAVQPDNMDLRLIKAKLLEHSDPEAAYAALAEALGNGATDLRAEIVAAQLRLAIDPSAALLHAERVRACAPHEAIALTTVCQAKLALGHADAAAELAAELRRRWPLDQSAVGLQATAWRILGDPRYTELYDYKRFVRDWVIDTPAGWTSLEAYLADLARSLDRLHLLKAHPIGLSLRGGSQTNRALRRVDDPAVQAFFAAIDGPIRKHIAAIGAAQDYRVAGIWSVKLRPNGYHVNHVHPMGWLSSACYIVLPKVIESGTEGWIKFGEPGIPTAPKLEAEHFVKPAPGKLMLFPSYMWHGTVAFGGYEPRLTVAFDLKNVEAKQVVGGHTAGSMS